MKSIQEMTQAEAGAFVQSHLREKGILVVLSDGASVAIYTNGKYVSQDLDLINVYSVNRRAIRQAMNEIGFNEDGRYFKHPNSQFIVEFPPGPLTVGEEPVKQVDEIRLATGILRIISPTDCVKDRLAAYYTSHGHELRFFQNFANAKCRADWQSAYRYTKHGAWSAGGFKIKERSLCTLSVYHWGDQ